MKCNMWLTVYCFLLLKSFIFPIVIIDYGAPLYGAQKKFLRYAGRRISRRPLKFYWFPLRTHITIRLQFMVVKSVSYSHATIRHYYYIRFTWYRQESCASTNCTLRLILYFKFNTNIISRNCQCLNCIICVTWKDHKYSP